MYTPVDFGNVTATHIKAQEDLMIVDRILEPQTVVNFLSFACGNPLPNGEQPAGERLTEVDVQLLQESYPLGSDGPSIMERVMSRIGSEEDSDRLEIIGKNIKAMKSRLWEGIAPLSEQRWREKGLHLDENFDYAIQHITVVLAVFEYLNAPETRVKLRDTFNLIHAHWTDLDVDLNQQRAQRKEESISVAGLWTTYVTTHFEVLALRAHRWVYDRIESLRTPILQKTRAHVSPMARVGQLSQPDDFEWLMADRLHMLLECAVKADYAIMTVMDEGYNGYQQPEKGNGPPEFYLSDTAPRGAAYAQHMKQLSHELQWERMARDMTAPRRRQTSGENIFESSMDQIIALDRVRVQLRGPPVASLPQEPWIASCLCGVHSMQADGKPPPKFGFLIYRLTYGQTDAEWAAFVNKLETHMNDWGTGQTGSHLLKPHLNLVWEDGRKHALPEDDIEAAKAHFSKAHDTEETSEVSTDRIQQSAFLVVDSASYASYTTPLYSAATHLIHPGDSTGFILAIDPDFDPEEGPSRADESPGYNGQVRIQGSLIWGDLLAFLESQSSNLEDIWPQAIDHPNQVYTGPTVPLQIFNWRTQNAARSILLRELTDHAKRKLGIPVTTPRPSSNPPSLDLSTLGTILPSVPRNTGTVRHAQAAPLDTVLHDGRLDEFQQYLRASNRDNLAERVEDMRQDAMGAPPDVGRLVRQMGAFEAARQPQVLGPGTEGEDPLRAFMLRAFERDMRRNNQPMVAEMAQFLREAPEGERSDPERIRQRVREFQERRERRMRAGLDPDEEHASDDEEQAQCPPM